MKNIFEATVISLKNCVFRAQVHRVVALQSVIKRCASKTSNRFVKVIHAHHDARTLKFGHFHLDWLAAILWHICHCHGARTGHFKVGRFVLITVGMTPNNDRLVPVRHQFRNVLADNRLAKHDAIQNVANRAIWRLPHLLQVKFFNSGFVGGYRCAFHADPVFQDCVCRINRHLVSRCITALDAQVVVVDVDIEIRQDQPIFNELPDDPRHFVAVNIDNRIYNFDLACHLTPPFS